MYDIEQTFEYKDIFPQQKSSHDRQIELLEEILKQLKTIAEYTRPIKPPDCEYL